MSQPALRHTYSTYYTWSHPLNDQVIAHKDGAVSLMWSSNGVDSELMNERECLNCWEVYYRLLHAIPLHYALEIHAWRESDDQLAQNYLAQNKRIQRAQTLATMVRHKMAAHLSEYARTNQVMFVLVKLPPHKHFFRPQSLLVQQKKTAHELVQTAQRLIRLLGNGSIVSTQIYCHKIIQSFSRAHYHPHQQINIHPYLFLDEQLITDTPIIERNQLRLGNQYTKVMLLHLYPNATPGWANYLLTLPATLHITQIILPINTQLHMRQTEREEDIVVGMRSGRDREYSQKNIGDLAGFRHFVVENNLSIFRNCFIVHIHSETEEQLHKTVELVQDWVQRQGGVWKTAEYMQLPFFRLAQPGQGYRSGIFRPDHTWQIGDMMPLQVYQTGTDRPESLRLGTGSQLVGLSIGDESIAHSFTIAMTGAGKGVEKGTCILETYPLGIDWYIAEVGQSYRWIVEGCGGCYTTIDPDKNVVNPLPPYQLANSDHTLPLDAKIVGGTVQTLGFLLTEGAVTLNAHQNAAAQVCLQQLYIQPTVDSIAPTLGDYQRILNTADHFDNQYQRDAARTMAANLESFLSTAEGRLFHSQENFTLSEGIAGVDLKDVMHASPTLLKFYLVFLSVRMAQLAFYRANTARILLDEMHVFANSFPEVIGPLISGIARMGRKNAGYIDLITQGIKEIDCLEPEILNSMPLRTLLYRPDGHNEIADRIAMRDGVLQKWKEMPYPEKLPYRPGLCSVGNQWFNLHLTVPVEVMAMTDTSQLARKERIARMTSDPIERIRLFYAGEEE